MESLLQPAQPVLFGQPAQKQCLNCKRVLGAEQFPVVNNIGADDRRSYWCRDCGAKLSDRERATQAVRARRNTEEGKRRLRDNHLRRVFGISENDYDEMLARQGGVCAVCGQPPSSIHPHRSNKVVRLAIDHCHETGKVRALLCQKCNRGIGWFDDDPDLLRAAAAYIESHRAAESADDGKS